MMQFRPRLWTAAGLGLLVAGGLSGCGDGDIMKEEPTPPPANTEALVQPGTAEAAAQAAARDAGAAGGADASVSDQTGAPPRRLPDGIGEGGESSGGSSAPG